MSDNTKMAIHKIMQSGLSIEDKKTMLHILRRIVRLQEMNEKPFTFIR